MKILFVVDQLQDLVSDPLYIGLVRLLGQEQVVDFPSKNIFHRREDKRWFLPQVPDLGYLEADICDLLRDKAFDLVCVASHRSDCLANLERLRQAVPLPPIVYIDGADDSRIRHEVDERFQFAAYFKREYRWTSTSKLGRFVDCARAFHFNRRLFERTYPLTMCVVPDAIPQHLGCTKDIDVSFYGIASHQKRAQAMALLEPLAHEGLTVAAGLYAAATDKAYKLEATTLKRLIAKIRDPSTVPEEIQRRKLSPEDYYRTLARSKVAVSIRGGGFDTLRYWEIVASGTFLLSEKPDIVIPHNYEHRNHAVFCQPDLSDLQELVRYYASHDTEREAIAGAGHAHLLKFHACEPRAAQFLEICRKAL